MSDRFDFSAITAALDARPPAMLDRLCRVKLLGEFAEAALSGRQPSRESALFVAGGIATWLSRGGNLTKEYWQVSAPMGSHRTPANIWRGASSSRGGHGTEDVDTLAASLDEGEQKI